MGQTTAFTLAFHVESPDITTDLLPSKMAQIQGVEQVETRVSGPSRGIDAQSVAEMLILITATTKTGVTVTAHIAEIISNVKKIAAESGLSRASVEIDREKRDLSSVGPDDIGRLAKRVASPEQEQ